MRFRCSKIDFGDVQRDDHVSSIRNKLLAESFYLMGEIEKYGTGFVRIRQWLKSYPEIGFEISEIGDFFRIEVFQTTASDLKNDLKSASDDLTKDLIIQLNLPDSQKRILLAISENRFITQQQLSKYIGITPNTIRNNMKKLKERGLLEVGKAVSAWPGKRFLGWRNSSVESSAKVLRIIRRSTAGRAQDCSLRYRLRMSMKWPVPGRCESYPEWRNFLRIGEIPHHIEGKFYTGFLSSSRYRNQIGVSWDIWE